MTFNCPHCLPRIERFSLWFANPLDGGPAMPPQPNSNNHRWKREGKTFATLTLSPSVNCFVGKSGEACFEQHWHGFIREGAVRP